MEMRHPLILIGLFALLAACNKSEPQDHPNQPPQDRGVMQQSQTQTDQYRSATSANTAGNLASNSDSQQDTQGSGSATPQPSKLLAATADANYKLTMEQVAGERDAAMKQCDGMTMEQAKSCRDRAAAKFARAQAQAENARNARTPADVE